MKLRVRHFKANEIVKELTNNGFEAKYMGQGTADPYKRDKENVALCPHDAMKNPSHWGSIVTNANGNDAHKIVQSIKHRKGY